MARGTWPEPDLLPDLGKLGYTRVPPGSDPPDAFLAPERDEDLPAGVWHGAMDPTALPSGPASVNARTAEGWRTAIIGGAGWAIREGKGPTRGDATRPKLKILEPCLTITLRAAGVDTEWTDVVHHVVIGWTRIVRSGKSGPEYAWVWSSEPAGPGVLGRRDGEGRRWQFRANPRTVTLAIATAVLAQEPSDGATATALAPAEAALAEAMLHLADGKRIRGV